MLRVRSRSEDVEETRPNNIAYITHLLYGNLQPVVSMPAGVIALLVLGELSRLPAAIDVVAKVLALPNIPLLDLPGLFSERPKPRKFIHCCWQHNTEFVAFSQLLAERLVDE